ncbi:NlpC/P60 family protein [Arcobacter cloacae]|uniref:Peptidase P60 n=1 Tax=Arcobacter cloacae TaxID=1054034 RepID=A0A6M8NHR9_9BACT|nr:NlpC/P60 family protein [Arcobacter cloacae]QKF90855.1 outer membrane lipoprotein, NlpC/P60 family [Arcobacter cloacae]RXI43142.1 peptidase P60 [Arcobacter cloacae]
MNFKNIFTMFIFTTLFFTGCSYKSSEEVVDMSSYNKNKNLEHTPYKNIQKNTKIAKTQKSDFFKKYTNQNYTSKKQVLNNELFDFYSQWEGVRYKLGGSNKSGIDCSGFIQKAFKEKFDLEMPRTTVSQSKIGKEIDKNELEVGDLVFFKTGRTNHVGIYIDNGKFMHASTKIGVTISDLQNEYFKKSYWKAQRVID